MKSSLSLLRLLKYFLRYKWRVISGLIAVAVMSAADTASAFLTARLFEILQTISKQVQSGADISVPVVIKMYNWILYSFHIHGKDESFQLIYRFAFAFIIVIVLKVVFMYMREYLMSSVREKFLMRFRIELFDTIIIAPIKYFDTRKTGQIMSRLTNDVNNLEQSVTLMIDISQNIIYTIIFAVALFLTNWQLTIITIVLFSISGVISRKFGDRIRFNSRELTNTIADISAFLQEKISAIRIVKSFAREVHEKGLFKKKAESNYHYSMKIARIVALLNPLNELFNISAASLLIIITGFLFIRGVMTMESMIYFMIMMIFLSKPVKALGESFARIQKTLVSAAYVFEIIDSETEPQRPSMGHYAIQRGEVEFNHVTFGYNDSADALKNINLKIHAGESVALVGPSGSGKTSLINLIPRFYELRSGEILIDGINIKTIPLVDLREQIAIVPQDVVLFSGTIYDNIRYGRLEASREEIISAAQAANAHEFIERMEKGFQTEIGERGVQISGGQRQRIAIARAILRNPRILLLDEATSALDTESEKMVQEALNHLMINRTSFIIAHRLSTVVHCDRIIVLEGGSMVEEGTHEELLQNNNGLYKKLSAFQFTDKPADTNVGTA